MNKGKLTSYILIAGILITAGVSTSIIIPSVPVLGQTSSNASSSSASLTNTVIPIIIRDSSTVLLDGKTIPAMDYIHLYDATPFKIMMGHVAAKVPCDTNSVTPLQMLIGQAPNLKPASLELIKELSKPGNMCLYHYNIPEGSNITTDIALKNPTNYPIKMPDTSSVVIGVNEIAPITILAQNNSNNTANNNITK